MSAPATEIAVLTLKPNTPIEDVSTEAGQTFTQILNTTKSVPGFQRQYWGRQLENQNHLVLSIDWDSITSHTNWMQTPSYSTFLSTLTPLLDPSTSPNLIHLNFEPHPPRAPRAEAPVTEVAFFYLPASATDAQKSELQSKATKLLKTCTEGNVDGVSEADKARSFATGWVIEQMDYPEGDKAISLGLMVGWESKEAHLKMRESGKFAELVKPIREMVLPSPGEGRGMYHVSFTEA